MAKGSKWDRLRSEATAQGDPFTRQNTAARAARAALAAFQMSRESPACHQGSSMFLESLVKVIPEIEVALARLV